ncbi:hypothetical protein BDZ89DRAFT_1037170 [Hymenopellis radicata]|nr:hypothetical protein BDZ89DRAFT_1037170 [Hymenopellis radicata]
MAKAEAEAETEAENKEEWGCVRYPYQKECNDASSKPMNGYCAVGAHETGVGAVMDAGMRLCEAWLQRRDTEGVRERRAASIVRVRVRKWWRQTCRNAGLRGAREQHGWRDHVRGLWCMGERAL